MESEEQFTRRIHQFARRALAVPVGVGAGLGVYTLLYGVGLLASLILPASIVEACSPAANGACAVVSTVGALWGADAVSPFPPVLPSALFALLAGLMLLMSVSRSGIVEMVEHGLIVAVCLAGTMWFRSQRQRDASV